jgi:tRNA(Leu) C34 or U34 (ribose-2'-O)-methylase TrmL
MIRVALVEPEIPPNTGNIARLCAANGVPLHIVGAAGFRNSFGQPSAYVYGGQRYIDPFGWEKWYLQW